MAVSHCFFIIHLNQKGDKIHMPKENPIKNGVDLSSFILELYEIKTRIEEIIIELEKITNVQ